MPTNTRSVEGHGVVVLPRNARATILLAEDEPYLRHLLTAVLKAAGYHLITAEDGDCAMRLANGHYGKIDMLVSDIQMPGLSGPDLAKELKSKRPDLRILLMSGGTTASDAGSRDWRFLEKPFLLDKFLAEVRATLR